jgi:putative ABC transport system substrate-binding protein
MRRRDFITLVGGAAAAWPLAARAQQTATPVVGFLGSELPGLFASRLRAFHQGLNEAGYVEGRNVAIEYRWAEGQFDRLPALAADLARRQVAVIVGHGDASMLAAKAATATTPIIFWTTGDPVAMGVVASLSRPGGNLTGVTTLGGELVPKRLELLHELVPMATVIAVLVNPTNPPTAETDSNDLQAAARTLGVALHFLHASTEPEIDAAFATLVQLPAGALLIDNDGFLAVRKEQLAVLALRHALPAITGSREFPAAGGLMSYGGSLNDLYRVLGVYTGRVLKGEKPADLPVQQSTKIELIINLKTAKALGITFPLPLLGRADEVIE